MSKTIGLRAGIVLREGTTIDGTLFKEGAVVWVGIAHRRTKADD